MPSKTISQFLPAGLDEEVSDRDLKTIARELNDWKSLRPFLGLSRSNEKEISKSCRRDYEEQKYECLKVWKDTKGKEATYDALITAAQDAKFQSLADSVRAMQIKMKSTPPPDMEGVLCYECYSCV